MGDVGRMVYLGDSLSDNGLFYELSGQVLTLPIPPDSLGYAGVFSNGPVQSSVTPSLLGVEATYYAVGGAQALGSRTVQDYIDTLDPPAELLLPDPPQEVLDFDTYFGAQVDRFLEDSAEEAPEDGTAVAMLIGLNDYSGFRPTSPEKAPEEAADLVARVLEEVLGAAARIGATGVDKVLLYSLPGPSFFPIELPPAELALGEQIIAAHNAGLEDGAERLRMGGVDAEIVDTNRMADEILADPITFGFRPEFVKEPKLLGIPTQLEFVQGEDGLEPFLPPNPLVADVDDDQLPFYDLVHPTRAAHGVLGAFAAESIAHRVIFRGDGDSVVVGRNVAELVLSGEGDDLILSRGGGDVVLAGRGGDRVWAGRGDDIVAGGSGDDQLFGRRGDDVIAGSDGDDVLFGGRGDDLLIDGLGDDLVGGWRGDDAFLYTEAALFGRDNAGNGGRFFGRSGADVLYLALSEATRAAVEAELEPGADRQRLGSIDIDTFGIEDFVFLDPGDVAAGIDTPARLAEADLWGLT